MYCTENQCFDVQLDGAVGPGRRAIGGKFPLSIGATDPSGSCMAMQTFKSLPIHDGEKGQDVLNTFSCLVYVHISESKKSFDMEPECTSMKSLINMLKGQSADI